MEKVFRYTVGLAILTPFTLIVLLVLGLYNAWAIWLLWAWFGTPLTDITISFGQAAGIWLIASYVKSYRHLPEEASKHALVYELFQPGVLVVLGAVIHYWFF